MPAHQLTDQVKILHKVAIIADNQVLLLKRHGQAHSRPSCWDLPGGNAEWPKQTALPLLQHLHRADAVREVLEETGIQIEEKQITAPVFFDTVMEPASQIYTIIVGWRVVLLAKPEIVISAEHTEFTWVSPDLVSQFDFGFAGGPEGFLVQIINHV